MGTQALEHLFLAKGKDWEEAKALVVHFLKAYQLLRYDTFSIERIINGEEETFFTNLELGVERNKKALKKFIEELKREGYNSFEDTLELPQGYLSKIFHLIAHLLDGFFGIDSYFYNLLEDSHWVSIALMEKIKNYPKEYYLIEVKGFIEKPLSMFEILSPKKFLER